MRALISVGLLVACSGDPDPMMGAGNNAPAGVRKGSGWKELYGYKVDGFQVGIDGLRHVYPDSLFAEGENLHMVYSEETMQYGGLPLGTRMGRRFIGFDEPPVAFEPGVHFPVTYVPSTQQFIWDTAAVMPVIFEVRNSQFTNGKGIGFFRDGKQYYPAEYTDVLIPQAIGRGHIEPDGTHYVMDTAAFRYVHTPERGSYVDLNCEALPGDPPGGSPIYSIDAPDPMHPLFVAQGPVVWSVDLTLPLNDNGYHTCGKKAFANSPGADRAYLMKVGGAKKIVAVGQTHIYVYVYANDTLTLEADAAFMSDDPVAVTTDGESIWVGFLDLEYERRVTVLVQSGATFDVVGTRGFSTKPADPTWASVGATPPLLAASQGRIYVGYGQRAWVGLNDGLGFMWIVAPE